MKRIILGVLLCSVLTPLAARGADQGLERPYWSLELKGGVFIPDIDDWAAYYGRRDTATYGGSLAYKILPQLEAGIEGMYMRDSGQGYALQHGIYTGHVTYELAPLNVFILARGAFVEDQWVVPYAGGGWTRMFYKEEVAHQGTARGSTDGYHGRAGLQLLLDNIDPSAANNLFIDYGIHHTYLLIEVQYIRAMIDEPGGSSVNLGGTSYRAGFLFEF